MIVSRQVRNAGGAVCIAAAILGAAAPASAADTSGMHLMVAVPKLTPHLDPMGIMANVNWRVSQNVLETLIRYDYETGALKPGLATSWKRVKPTLLELKLRDGVTCHNGEAFTAEDVEVMFGPERYQGEGAPGFLEARAQLGIIKSVKAVDKLTVHVETSIEDPLLELRLANYMSEVPCADAYRKVGNWEKWGQSVVGTGPYKVTAAKPGELQRFDRFDGYWGDKAPVASFTLKRVTETGARVAGLLSGEYHIITEIEPDQFETIEKSPKTEVVGGAIQNIRSLIFDTRHPSLGDARMRRGLSLAIDRKLIVETVFRGKTSIPNGFQMKVFGDMYIDEFKPVGYDPERAKALIEASGYKGEEIAYWYLADYYTGEIKVAQILQQMWKAVGVNIVLGQKETWSQMRDEKHIGVRGITNTSNNAVYPDPIGQLYRNYGPQGSFVLRKYWNNDRFMSWSKDLLAIDPETRRNAHRYMLEIWEQDPPGTYLYNLPMFYGKAKSVSWKSSGTPFMDFRAGGLSIASN
ncbi:MAG: ABC transporter substrate-binding protein [Hyphomicrobiales bacterium]|nr:ABC transporter substrate-binding protein [Hyphomicrobiales bacterium]